MNDSNKEFLDALSRVNDAIAARSTELHSLPTTSTPQIISKALEVLPSGLPDAGLGLEGQHPCPVLPFFRSSGYFSGGAEVEARSPASRKSSPLAPWQ